MCDESCHRSLRGRSLVAGYFGYKPYVDIKAKPVTGSDVITLKLIAEKLNFDVVFKLIRRQIASVQQFLLL
jgi:hypothetical protein